MKKLILIVAIAMPLMCEAAKKPVPLSPEAGAVLAGKTLVVTRHAKPGFVAMTAGKAGFALLGAGLMIAAGNKIVGENGIEDPADIIERELAPALAAHYGAKLKEGPSPVVKPTKAKEIAATQADGDYLLDVNSIGWSFAYYPTDWNNYWTGYTAHVQLIERASGKLLSDMACGANNQKHPSPPTREQMLENHAKLLKDATASHGWSCVHTLAKEQFLLPDGAVAATPTEFVDPLATYAARNKGAPAPAATPTAAATPAN